MRIWTRAGNLNRNRDFAMEPFANFVRHRLLDARRARDITDTCTSSARRTPDTSSANLERFFGSGFREGGYQQSRVYENLVPYREEGRREARCHGALGNRQHVRCCNCRQVERRPWERYHYPTGILERSPSITGHLAAVEANGSED